MLKNVGCEKNVGKWLKKWKCWKGVLGILCHLVVELEHCKNKWLTLLSSLRTKDTSEPADYIYCIYIIKSAPLNVGEIRVRRHG